MKAKDAQGLGVVDAVFEPADFLEKSIAFAARIVSGKEKIERKDYSIDPNWDIGFRNGQSCNCQKIWRSRY